MNRIDISTEEKKQEVYELFKNFKNKSQIHEYYGISDNSQGCKYIKEIADEIGFDLSSYKKKETRYCLECGAELKKGQAKFCCKSCAVTYNNRQRDKSVYEKVASKLRKEKIKHQTLVKITTKNKCLVCGKYLIAENIVQIHAQINKNILMHIKNIWKILITTVEVIMNQKDLKISF